MTSETAEILGWFIEALRAVTADGAGKRAAGLKPSWKIDPSHEPAIWSHVNKWKHGEKVDPDSKQHPLVHAAWRCLAIAWQETHPEDNCIPGSAAISTVQDDVAKALDFKAGAVWRADRWPGCLFFSGPRTCADRSASRAGWCAICRGQP